VAKLLLSLAHLIPLEERMKRVLDRANWSTAVATLVFGAVLAIVVASCGDSQSPVAPGASARSGSTATEVDPVPLPTPTPEDPPPPPPPTPTPTPPQSGEGCTPGYWKQEQHFGSWTPPYDPSDLFSSVFENAFPGMTLLQVLEQGGGDLNALGRHTVAALLNAASPDVDYDLTVAQVIAAFNAVFPGGDYETLKNRLEAFNEQGCPLGRDE
jgi:hypothetical protein